jgi:serine/threonine-protein kinase
MFAQTIGKYHINRTIGSGAYGTVVEATDRVLNRTVALKVLRSGGATVSSMKTHLREAQALARLQHPNIVTIFDLGQEGEHTFLAMEHVAGESLAARLRQGAFAPADALAIARQLADALATAHKAGVVHADIKPANVILDLESRPLLVDFGLARLSGRIDSQGTLGSMAEDGIINSGKGTLSYMAPELFIGAEPDCRSDIFSFGALLFEMLSGHRAFAAANDGAVMQRIINGRPDPLSDICPGLPADLYRLVEHMLAPEPTARPVSMALVRDRLDALAGIAPTRASIGRLPSRLFARLRPLRRIFVVAGLVGGLSGALILAAGRDLLPNLPPRSLQSMITEGMSQLDHFQAKGATDAAVATFQKVLARDPQNAAATAGLSLALLRRYTMQRPDPVILKQADAAARLALSLDDQLALAHVAVAWAESYATNKAAAYDRFQSALTLEKGNALALEGLARLYEQDGRLDDAAATNREGIERHPDNPIFYDGLGTIHFEQADYAQAETLFRKSVEMAPDNPVGYANLSAAQHMQGRTSDAVLTVQQGLRIGPNRGLYNNLGTYLYFLGQYPQAAEAFEKLLKLEGNSQHFLIWGNLGDAYRWTAGKEEEARNAYRLALHHLGARLQAHPSDPGLNVKAALYHAKLQEPTPAVAALDLALAAPTPAILFDAAVVTEILGRREQALALLLQCRGAGYAQEEIDHEPELARLRLDRRYQQSLIDGEQNDK